MEQLKLPRTRKYFFHTKRCSQKPMLLTTFKKEYDEGDGFPKGYKMTTKHDDAYRTSKSITSCNILGKARILLININN
jgi:hypothetical protein